MKIFDFFGLSANPFGESSSSESSSPDAVLSDARFLSALDPLTVLPQIGTLATLTGRTGVGKTTLVHQLMIRWQEVNDVHYLHLGNLRSTGLLRALLGTLGEKPRLGKDRMFEQLYAHLARKQRPLCLVMDEAQLLDATTLTDLRILSAHPSRSHRLVLLLCGQPMLERQLQAESLTDLRERVALHAHLSSMQPAETIHYVRHRLRVAGGREDIFDEPALKMLHLHSDGVPRRVNQLALKALMNAWDTKKKQVNEKTLREACAADRS